VIGIAAALIMWKVLVATRVGPEWDTYSFVANAADYAGLGYGYTEPHRAPALPVIVSLIFRFTGLRLDVIQWVDGAISLSGVLAAYFLMRRRFPVDLSAIGALVFIGAAPLWAFIGVGYTDIAALAVMNWLLLVLVKATEDNPLWFLLTGPLFVTAVMTRYTVLLFAFVCLLWLAFRGSFLRHIRLLGMSTLLGLLVYAPGAVYYQKMFGDVLFPFIVAFSFSETVEVGATAAAMNPALFYVSRMPAFFGATQLAMLSGFILLVAGATLVTGIGGYIDASRPGFKRLLLASIGVVPAVLAQLGGGLALRQLAIPLSVFWVFRVLAPRDERDRTSFGPALDATMLTWLLIYLDFHGHQAMLVPRYYVPMAILVVYFVMRGWQLAGVRLSEALSVRRADHSPDRWPPIMVSVVLGAFVIGSLGTSVATTQMRRSEPKMDESQLMAEWLHRRPNTRSSVVFADFAWPLTAWNLRMDVRPLSGFDAQSAYRHELEKAKADYLVSSTPRTLPGFREVARAGGTAVLMRTAESTATLPRVRYLGKAWDNYMEQLTNYSFYLDSTAGRYGWAGSAFIDGLSAAELGRSDAVAVFGAKWKDRKGAEAALRRYVEDGGSLIFDASSNLGGLSYSMADTVWLDTIVRRKILPPSARIEVDPEFARRYGVQQVDSSPFLDEGGTAWAGAAYEPRPGMQQPRVIATAGTEPLVTVRELGKGRIYYVGYNLPWHAFSKENASEAALVRAIFADAIAHSRAVKEKS
jgi:hypothetical protein